MYSLVIQYFYRLYSTKSYYNIMAIISCAIQYILVAFLFVHDFYSTVSVNGSSKFDYNVLYLSIWCKKKNYYLNPLYCLFTFFYWLILSISEKDRNNLLIGWDQHTRVPLSYLMFLVWHFYHKSYCVSNGL